MNTYGLFGLLDPNEVSEGEKPTRLVSGIYKFRREAFDTEIDMEVPLAPGEEPGRDGAGQSFTFEFFELENFLRVRFGMPEELRGRLLDLVWNFLRVAWKSGTEHMWTFDEVAP